MVESPIRQAAARCDLGRAGEGSLPGGYGATAFDRLPVLADALADAGCDNDNLLSHCRGDGPHVRGCWAVDLLLGRR